MKIRNYMLHLRCHIPHAGEDKVVLELKEHRFPSNGEQYMENFPVKNKSI